MHSQGPAKKRYRLENSRCLMRAAYSGSCRGLGRPEGHGVRAGLGSQVGLRWVVLLPPVYWPNKAGIPHGATSVKQVGSLMSVHHRCRRSATRASMNRSKTYSYRFHDISFRTDILVALPHRGRARRAWGRSGLQVGVPTAPLVPGASGVSPALQALESLVGL